MIRTTSLALLGLALTLAVAGCGNKPEPKPDMPVKTSSGVDKKGKKMKTMDATLEDPSVKK
jgi:hypothetical protein